MRILFASILVLALVAASGCASKSSSSSGSPEPTGASPGTSSGPATGATNSTNANGTKYSCTATPGGGVGTGGGNVVTVAGCTFTTSKGRVQYMGDRIDANCQVEAQASGSTSYTVPKKGEKFDKDTLFSLACGAQNTSGTGDITLLDLE